MEAKQQVIAELFKQGILVTPEIMHYVDSGKSATEIVQLTQSTISQTSNQSSQSSTQHSTTQSKHTLPLDEHNRAPLKIVQSYVDNPKEYKVQDFVNLFNTRFEFMSKILRARSELDGLTSIKRLQDLTQDQRRNFAVIGYVTEISETKNGHILCQIEDKTGTIRVLFNKSKDTLIELAQQLVLDDIIGVSAGMSESNDIIFANNIVFPDVPLSEIKKTPFPLKAVFTSDLHFGAKMFMTESFNKFIDWLNGDTTTGKEREEVMQIKYLFLVGDLVEGVGIYPNQENDLAILDVKEQYDVLATYLQRIRKDIHIIACGGNHDAMRIAEPQPVFRKEYCQALYDLENFTALSNPSLVNIGATQDFPGIDVLMYHGYSFPYYFDSVDFIRKQGGIERIDIVMEFLLKRRHLAPTHTATQYIPDSRDDFLLIKRVPDIFASGHVHKVVNAQYKHVSLLNCSAWFGETDYMIKRGIVADPAKVLVCDLQTRKTTIKDFEIKEEQHVDTSI